MRILFLDAYFIPEQIAFTHLENDLIQELVESGHEIEVVCPTPTRGISKEVEQKYKKIKSEGLYGGHVHVRRFSAPHEGKNPIIRTLRYFWCNLRTYQIGEKMNNIDVVFANSTPPTQGWIAGKVAKKLAVPFIYLLQDIFPDSLVNAGMAKKGSLLWRIGRKIEDRTYSYARQIVTISDDFRENIIYKGVKDEKIAVIPNWIDNSKVFPVAKEDNLLFDRYGLDRKKFYICYCGNIGHSQNLGLLVAVAEQLQKENKEINFIIVGEGVARESLEREIAKKSIKNISLIPFQPYGDIASVFSMGDVGLVISKPGVGESSIPSKTWSFMAAERPILVSFDESSDLFKLINGLGCGLAVRAGSKNDLIRGIYQLYDRRHVQDNMGAIGRKYVIENLSSKVCTRKYVSLIRNL